MKHFFSLLFFIALFNLHAQSDLHCGSDLVMNNWYKKHPEAKQRREQHDHELAANLKSQRQLNTASYTIPVVFHILHVGGPENISDAQVIDALNILNRDFAKKNADTVDIIPSMKPVADSMGIQFALARLDPNGNCTSGIIHHYDPNTDWTDMTPYDYTWDPTRYMNVYIVRTISFGSGFGAAGYTYFPGTFAPGDPLDAIVVLNNYFGSIGTGSVFTSRVLTHEVGHWLGLYHVFGGTNGAGVDCFTDDYISDTPTTAGFLSCPDANDPSTYQICTPGVDENFQNYMDYSYCVRMFTQEQGAAMRFCLQQSASARDNLSLPSNLLATGVSGPPSDCVPVADFYAERTIVCAGSPVTFHDASWQGAPSSYTWTLTGAIPSMSNAASPTVIYNTPGFYTAELTTANTAGVSSPNTKPSYIQVIPANAANQFFLQEGFESDVFGTIWQEYSSSGGSRWMYTSDAGFNVSTGSAVIPYASNTRNMKTWMESPSVDLSTIQVPTLAYYYAGQETNPEHVNSLKVYITTDCGVNWALIDSIGGMDLASSGIGAPGFIPLDNEWAIRVVDLSAFSTASSGSFKFLYTRDTISGANNFYIDNINVNSFVGIQEKSNSATVKVYPNPSDGVVYVETDNIASIIVTDICGRKVEKHSLTNKKQVRLFAKEKPEAGVYFIQAIDNAGNKSVSKVIIN